MKPLKRRREAEDGGMSEREWSPLDHIFTIRLSDKGKYPYASRVFLFDDDGIAEAQKWLCKLKSRSKDLAAAKGQKWTGITAEHIEGTTEKGQLPL